MPSLSYCHPALNATGARSRSRMSFFSISTTLLPLLLVWSLLLLNFFHPHVWYHIYSSMNYHFHLLPLFLFLFFFLLLLRFLPLMFHFSLFLGAFRQWELSLVLKMVTLSDTNYPICRWSGTVMQKLMTRGVLGMKTACKVLTLINFTIFKSSLLKTRINFGRELLLNE